MKIPVYLFVFFLAISLFSCDDNDDSNDLPDEIVPELSATPLSLNFGQDGGTDNISIASNTIWNISSSASWCISTIQTSKGNAKVKINVTPNDVEEERMATITIRATDVDDVIVSVTQEAKESDQTDPGIQDYIEPDMTGMSSDATTLASKMFLGWNLGNTMEASGGETAWGNPITTNEMIAAVKESGINAIRIPCSWDQYLEDQITYKIKESWMERVTEVVDYCVNNDTYVILNIHWDGGWMENNCTPEKQEEVGTKLTAIWKQIALNFREYDEHLLFAGANEPNGDDEEQANVIAAHMQTFVNTVRATGGRNAYRNLVVQAPSTDIDKADDWMTLPTDSVENRLFAEVHYYSPYQFCLMSEDESWGKMFYFWGEPYHLEGAEDRNPTWGEEDYMEAEFNKMKTKFVDQGVPVILGEFAAMRRSFPENALWQETHDKSRAYFYQNVAERSKNNGMVPFFWDTGEGIIDRNNLSIYDESDYNALITGATDGIYPF